ncbi:STAS domain-containing protein [Tenacibaculum mesophilum]|uniref:STAS domain-containing protein n=1 Tax=Tenacibaculum mesophilum TaxID=104268 RepID=A0ABM7CDK7_9FLAO|nr:STAS domain-containing protein [Tenacibaculum mesophilum]AZJ31848.1 STAS domain-containing protein [Tenacibaculum mesophilum]QFS27103.1 STAS domain-containing protein [Tenacibaculum mesophilum]SHF84816.1 STAS domain-containing protein [Tenacibaculum mesophilum]
MEFKIKSSKNYLKISGDLTLTNVQLFEVMIYSFIKKYKDINIDISNVTNIDTLGVNSIVEAYQFSLKNKKNLLFCGKGSKDIMDELYYRNVA